MPPSLQQTMFLWKSYGNPIETTPMEISDLLHELKYNCACGLDGIKAAPIKAISDEIFYVLSHLCTLILETGTFPHKMKIAKVSVLYKAQFSNISNYRPITIPPLFSKIAEKVINARITIHLKNINCYLQNNMGFKRGNRLNQL